MNIEQLNGSGQQIRVFFITAVIALAVTGGSWFAIEQTNIYRKWRRRTFDTPYGGKTQFALIVRLAMLAGLIWHGHSRWMLRTGVGWRLLTNHRSRILTKFASKESEVLNAGEYVSKWTAKRWRVPKSGYGLGVYGNVQWIDVEEEE